MFLKHDYVEAKDLCKQFLTVNIGVVVFSLTFAEKIISFATGTRASRILLVCCWSGLLASIIGCGVSLAYISVAAGQVAYGERSDCQRISVRTMVGIALSGGVFVVGLILLATAAGRTVLG